MSGKSLLLALVAGVAQYIQISRSLPALEARKDDATMGEDFARSFQFQMRYIFPVVVVVIAYVISAAIALYWATSNIVAIGQEYLVRKEREKLTNASANTDSSA